MSGVTLGGCKGQFSISGKTQSETSYSVIPTYILIFLHAIFNVHIVSSSCYHKRGKDGVDPLPMYFSNDTNIIFLFDYFRIRCMYEFIFCNIMCFLLGFLSIYIKAVKRNTFKKYPNDLKENLLFVKNIPVDHRLTFGMISFINYAVDYLLMLLVMTFNLFIFLSTMVGIAVGYFFCGHLLV
ncbi:copper transporter [Plasmodium brasilianum]|nr:copper transporter [Plasmodium brasilianum]